MNRTALRTRASGRCEYCRDPEAFSLAAFHIEHITARRHGGGDDEANLAFACPDCNFAKETNLAAIDPETGALSRLFHPRRDDWDEHFTLFGTRVAGRPPEGRTTIHLLGLNKPERLRHRELLLRLGVW